MTLFFWTRQSHARRFSDTHGVNAALFYCMGGDSEEEPTIDSNYY